MSKPFKMKGSPFQRNFGAGKSPMKNYQNPEHYKSFNMGNPADELTPEEKDAFGNSPADMGVRKSTPGPAYMKSPMKDTKRPHSPNGMPEFEANRLNAEADAKHQAETDHPHGGPKMKSSSFKMRDGSPFHRNFGVGESPAKLRPTYKTTQVARGYPDIPVSDEELQERFESYMRTPGKIDGKPVQEVHGVTDFESWITAGQPSGSGAGGVHPSEKAIIQRGEEVQNYDKAITGVISDWGTTMEGSLEGVMEKFTGDDLAAAANDLLEAGKITEEQASTLLGKSKEQLSLPTLEEEVPMTEEDFLSLEGRGISTEAVEKTKNKFLETYAKNKNLQEKYGNVPAEQAYNQYIADIKQKGAKLGETIGEV